MGGPYIGPKGGKWKDAKHTIPWAEAKPAHPFWVKKHKTGVSHGFKTRKEAEAHRDQHVSVVHVGDKAALPFWVKKHKTDVSHGFKTRKEAEAHRDQHVSVVVASRMDEGVTNQARVKKSMRFVIPTRRAGVADLLKAFSRGPRPGVKYIKKVPYFSGGKMRWRYYYRDDDARRSGRAHHDPHDEHDHHLIEELKAHHENLRGKVRSAIETGMEYIKGLFGFKKRPETVAGKQFTERHIEPALQKEREGAMPDANAPTVKTAKAIEMIPDHMKQMVDPAAIPTVKGGLYKGLKSFQLLTNEEDEYTASQGPRGAGIGGHANRTKGTLIIDDLSYRMGRKGITSKPEFGSSETITEEVIWHEFGHHVHFAIEESIQRGEPQWKAAWDQWTGGLGGKRISGYAHTNAYEDFAEAYACMISHPKQMARICRERYDWMQQHLFEHLPEREEMMKVDDDELAWWSAKPHTKVTEALIQARKKEGSAVSFHPMHSEKDQFYTLSVDGRTVYVRMGPASKMEEDGWDRMPDTTYTETIEGADGKPVTVTLPRNENLVGARFKALLAAKEIYDESGKPLTNHQAFLHLAQDDQRLIDKLPENIEEYGRVPKWVDSKAKKKVQAKGPDGEPLWTYKVDELHTLSRRMFESLGFKGEHTKEREAARLKKVVEAQKKYDAAAKKKADGKKLTKKDETVLERGRPDFSWDLKAGKPMGRMQWAPKEMSRHEFMQKSGTFAFGEIRASKNTAPHVALNEDGSAQLKADGTPVTTATVYEQENPDGSWTKITVSTAAPFSRGDTILVPDKAGNIKRKKLASGTLDPFIIAREHGTTAKKLLALNRKFGRAQITDPILSALINPGGIPIADATKFQELMREAAQFQGVDPETGEPYVGKRAWVTLAGAPRGDGTGVNRATTHIQVQFDGAGPPLVVGPYWERKLGKSPVRIDELLNRFDTITTPIIKELKPKTKKPEPGGLVWFTDPKTDRRVLGTYAQKKKDPKTGKELFMVQPTAGQVSGQSKHMVGVRKISGVSEDLVRGNPGKRKRIVRPLERDLLLFMNEVTRGSGAYDTQGVVQIKLPKDGSISIEEVKKYPGVSVIDPLPGDTDPRITLDSRALPEFRARAGGFMMGSRVLAKLEELDTTSRALADESGKSQVVEPEELEDKDGNVNPEGPLRGLVTGDDGIQPGEHRIRALQKLAKNQGRLYAAHFMGTGKTALAVMASQMMRNLADPGDRTKPHPKQVKKKVLHVVPLNTAENWYQEYVRFSSAPTLLGAGTLSGAQQLPQLPKRGDRESDNAYKGRVLDHWRKQLQADPKLWNPWTDASDDAVIPMEYFRDNEEALRLTGMFDGLVVDEAHKVARENQLSRAIERWNPQMNMFLLLSGTPITNNLKVLPRIVELVTDGAVKLGTEEEFTERYLVESQVLKAYGRRKAPKTDLNPQRVGELAGILQPIMDVATTADVKGKSMPAVLLDENEPAHMIGQQGRMYRAAMGALTDQEREALGASAAIGLDEAGLLDPEARRKIAVARSIANAPSYKAPDERQDAVYEAITVTEDKHGRAKIDKQTVPFELPTLEILTGKRTDDGISWGGRWPDQSDVEAGRVNKGYYEALHRYIERVLGVGYEYLEGKKITSTAQGKKLIAALRKKGEYITLTGEKWGRGQGKIGGSKIKNPDYGPEGMICRGRVDEVTGEITKIDALGIRPAEFFNSQTGAWEGVEVEPGHLFVRDPRVKATGLFYDQEDWDFTGRFKDAGEGAKGDAGEGDDGPEIPDVSGLSRKELEKLAKKHDIELPDDLDDDDYRTLLEDALRKKVLGAKGNQQGPLPGREGMSIQRHPARRKQRAQFDLSVTTNNAKCDKLEEVMREQLKDKTGSPNDQMIIFGNRIGSSVRTAEAKLRTMGYMDINEALGHPEWSSDHDKTRAMGTRKFFVSYMGKGATLGDRDINSEIFRRVQDDFGGDTGVSLFVQRTMYGTKKDKLLKAGEMSEPWGSAQRAKIKQNFVDGRGAVNRNGTPAGLEVPMRVMGWENEDGSIGQRYVYESELTSKVKREVKALEVKMRAQRGDEKQRTHNQIRDLLKPHASERKPLTEAQQDILNNTQMMVASDAANVGLNWPAKHLIMYDSLFSPMEEWQRITRAARMLPPAVRGPAKKYIEKVGAYISEVETKNDFKEYEGIDSAMLIVREAMENALTQAERDELNDLPGGAPDQIVEAWFAKRAFDKIAGLREEVGNKLRRSGDVPDPTRPESYIPPEAITESDVMNHIIRKKLTGFDKEILKSRRYLVDVKRLTVSVDMPEFVQKKNPKPPPKKIRIATGNMITESPALAEKSQLAQGRAKMVPYEYFLKIVQNEQPKHTKYDYIPSWRGSLAAFSLLEDGEGNPVGAPPQLVEITNPDGTRTFVTKEEHEEAAAGEAKKSLPSLYIPRWRL